MAHGFDIGRPFNGTLPRTLPVWQCLRRHAGFRIVMGEQFGLDIGDFGELCCQHLRDPLMILLPRALQ